MFPWTLFQYSYTIFYSQRGISKDRRLIQVPLAASNKTVARKWLNPEPPTVNEWIDIIYDIVYVIYFEYIKPINQ